MESLGNMYRAFGGLGMAAGKMVSGLDVSEIKLINMYKVTMGGGAGPGKSDRIVTAEVLKEKEQGKIN